ncbi:MAG: carbohydrate kinase family protein [Anaerolineae bacterium]|nr:carbohydrate kinase family protein [Anaerolineae bacterium]
MDSDRPVVVIGAAGIDIKVRPHTTLQMGRSNLGRIRNSVGGVARNIAENLARLEVPTVLLSAVGQDSAGDWLVRHTSAAGVDTTHVQRLPEVNTGSYVALLDQAGQLTVSVSDYDIVEAISPAYLQKHRGLLAGAAMIVIDANLSPRALESVFLWAGRYDIPVCADPTSAMLSDKLIKHLPQLYMVAPDAIEANALCGTDQPPTTSEEAINSAQCLVSMGADVVVVTLAEQGLAYADGSSAGHIPALRTSVVDTTGVGDALTAAVIFGLVNEMPLDEAVRLGISAAALTLRTRETVVPDLSLDRIYDELVV